MSNVDEVLGSATPTVQKPAARPIKKPHPALTSDGDLIPGCVVAEILNLIGGRKATNSLCAGRC